jgi:hypothetical protein
MTSMAMGDTYDKVTCLLKGRDVYWNGDIVSEDVAVQVYLNLMPAILSHLIETSGYLGESLEEWLPVAVYEKEGVYVVDFEELDDLFFLDVMLYIQRGIDSNIWKDKLGKEFINLNALLNSPEDSPKMDIEPVTIMKN